MNVSKHSIYKENQYDFLLDTWFNGFAKGFLIEFVLIRLVVWGKSSRCEKNSTATKDKEFSCVWISGLTNWLGLCSCKLAAGPLASKGSADERGCGL